MLAIDLPTVVILLGPPGSGKGTHAGPLSKKLAIPHISTGALFREHIHNQTELGRLAKAYIDQGKLVPDVLVLDMLFDRVLKEDCKNGYILDGFPRTEAQAIALDERLGGKYHALVLNFKLDDATIVDRISGRRSCTSCSRPYHIVYDAPKTQDVCDACGSLLEQRFDDRKEVVLKRLFVYHEQTAPLIRYYQAKIKDIDSKNEKAKVLLQVLAAVSSHIAV